MIERRMHNKLGLAAALTVAAALATAPGQAAAATVSMDGATFRYVAADGERSQVTVTRHAGAFEVRDPVAPLVAGSGCVSPVAGVAVCAAPSTGFGATIELGDDSDWVLPRVDAGLTQSFAVDGGPGDDTVQGAGGDDRVAGGSGQDWIDGHAGDDVLLPGPDVVDDTVTAGDGEDTVSYEDSPFGVGIDLDDRAVPEALIEDRLHDGIEHAIGSQGDDVIVGDAAANDLHGGGGDDVIRGGDGEDDARGGAGDDTVDGGAALDSVSGDAGNDTLLGGDARDNLYGWDGNDTMDGGDGDDNLHGDAGDDTLRGGDGDDHISAGAGVNVLDGGAGGDDLLAWGGTTDTVTYADRTAPVAVSVADGTTTLPANDGEAGEGDTVVGAETVIGGAASDTLIGHAGANVLLGGGGDDTLDGGGGADRIDGGAGLDALQGGAGDDLLAARDGLLDHVRCGAGADGATGDPRDRFEKDCESVKRAVH